MQGKAALLERIGDFRTNHEPPGRYPNRTRMVSKPSASLPPLVTRCNFPRRLSQAMRAHLPFRFTQTRDARALRYTVNGLASHEKTLRKHFQDELSSGKFKVDMTAGNVKEGMTVGPSRNPGFRDTSAVPCVVVLPIPHPSAGIYRSDSLKQGTRARYTLNGSLCVAAPWLVPGYAKLFRNCIQGVAASQPIAGSISYCRS
jgi:hypothetical protein